MQFLKKFVPVMLGLSLLAGSVYGQGKKLNSKDVSKQELTNFVNTYTSMLKLRQQARGTTQKVLQDNGLKPKRYQMIMMSKKNPKMADTLDISAKEQKSYKKVQSKLAKQQKKFTKKFQGILKKNGLKRQRFQMIAQSMQGDKQLQQRFQKIRAKQMNLKPNGNSSSAADSENTGN